MGSERNRRTRWDPLLLGAVAGLGLATWVDLGSRLDEATSAPVRWCRYALALAVMIGWWRAAHQPAGRLARTASWLATVSLAVTVVVPFSLRDESLVGGFASWGAAESLGLLLLLFQVSRRGGSRRSPLAMAMLGAAVAAVPLRHGFTDDALVNAALVQALAAAGVAAAGTYQRVSVENRRRTAEATRAEQRAEFARDLHDFIAHHVTGIIVQAQGARSVAGFDPQRTVLALERIEQAGAETMTAMRRMVRVLRDPDAVADAPLAPLAGVADLGALLASFTGPGAAVARLHTDGDLSGLPIDVSTSAYRVVMEALTNVRQHAVEAGRVDVRVRRTADALLVRVVDDGAPGRGAAARDGRGYGLVGLGERVRALGGRITAGPDAEAGGWVVEAVLPLVGQVDA